MPALSTCTSRRFLYVRKDKIKSGTIKMNDEENPFNWVDLPEGSFTTNLVTARVNYTFTLRMFFSGLLQYNSSNDTLTSNLRLRWEYQPGSELFVVYTEDRDTARLAPRRFSQTRNHGFVVKLNKLFRY